jgi:flagellar biogenesis protein FliO
VVLLVLFVLLLIWLIPKLWRGLMALRRGFQRLFARDAEPRG